MPNDNEVQVKFGAQTDGFSAGVQKATLEMRKTADAFKVTQAEAIKADEALAKYIARLDPAYRANKLLSDGVLLLDKNLQAGNISAATHAQMLQKVQASYGMAESGAKGMSFATAGVSREILVLGHEAMTGNFSRMPGTMMVLAERMGGLHHAFAFLATPIGLATIALAGLTAAMAYAVAKSIQLESQMQSLRDNMTATGRSGVYTKQQFEDLKDTLHEVNGVSKKSAGEIVDIFMRAHKIGAPLMQDLIGIVVKFANATGKDAPDAAKELAKAFSDPEKGAKALREELGQFLTPAQNALIESQIRSGQVAQGQATLFAALRDRLREVGNEARKSTFALMMEGLGKAAGRIADDAGTERAQEEAAEAVEAKRREGIQRRAAEEQSAQTKALKGVNEALDASSKFIPVGEKRKALGEEIRRTEEAITAAKAAGIASDDAGLQKLQGRLAEQKRELADMRGKGDQSRVQGYKAELEAMKTAESGFLDFSKAREIEFWQSKLATLRKGSADYAAVEQEIFSLRKAKAKQDLDEQVAEIKAQGALYRQGSQERIRAAQEAAKLIGAAYGLESKQYKDAQKEINAELRAAQQYQRQIAEEILNAKRAYAKVGYDIARDELAFKRGIGAISAQEQIASLRQIEQQEYQSDRKILEGKRDAANVEELERTKLNGQIEQLEANHQRRMIKLNQDAAMQAQHKWTTFWQPVQSSFSSGIAGLIMKTQTLKQAMQSVAQAMLTSFINMGVQMLADWVAKTAIMKAIKAAFGIESAAVDTATVISGVAAAKAEAAGEIPSYAAIGATAAMASVAAIPFIGWAMAPEVGAAHFETAMGYMPMASAAGGWEVPADTMAMVHEQEMILPASISNHIRASMRAGGDAQGGGGDTHNHYHSYNISAVDGDSVRKFFRNHRGAMSSQIKTSVRDHGLRMPK